MEGVPRELRVRAFRTKWVAALATAIMVGTIFSQMVGASGDAAIASEGQAELPKSPWDFSILDSGNATFPKWAVGSDFYAYFAPKADADSILRLQNLEGVELSVSLRPLANNSGAVATVQASSITDSDTKAEFDGAFGETGHVQYKVGLTGAKETIRFDQRPTAAGDLFVSSVVKFDAGTLVAQINGTNVTGYFHWDGDVSFVGPKGAERFRIPRAFVVDSSGAQGRGSHFQWLEYQLDGKPGELAISVVIPEKYLNDSSLTWPIFIDPTYVLPSSYTGDHSYSDCDIYMESSLLLNPGSSLTLDRCTIHFNGNYQFEVASGATLTMRNSTVRSNSSAFAYAFFMNGTLTLDHSSVYNTTTGVLAATGSPIWMNASTLVNSTGGGISILGEPSSLWMNGTTIAQVSGSALLVDNYDFGWISAPAINGTTVSNAHVGVDVRGAVLPMAITNLSISDVGATAVSLDWSSATFRGVTVSHASEAFRAQNSTLTALNSTARYLAVGTSCIDSTVTLDEVTLYKVGSLGFNATNCEAHWVDGNYFAWTRSLSSTSIEVLHRLYVQVLDEGGAPLADTGVTFIDAQGNAGAPSLNTGADGMAGDFVLKEFLLDAGGAYTLYTPHRLEIGVSGTPAVHTYVGGPRTLRVHATSDMDADGLSNAEEDLWENVLWMEAEYLMRADGQVYQDLYASNDIAVKGAPDGRYFTDLGWPTLPAGTYQLLVRAAGNGLNASLDLNVTLADGTTVVPTERHELPAEYSWISARTFVLSSASRVIVNATSYVPQNSTFFSAEAVLLDKIALIRLKDGNGVTTGFTQGQRTDPLDNDTDFDGLTDGAEATSARGWFDAEVLSAGATTVDSPQASGGLAIVHPGGSAVVLNKDLMLEGYAVASQTTYQVYARVRALQGASSNVTLSIASVGPPASGTYSVGSEWQWVAGPVVTTPVFPPPALTVQVTDADAPSPWNQAPYIALDEVAVFDMASLNLTAGGFNATSPLDADMDRDGVADGPEINGFFTADIVQAENYTSANAVENRPHGIVFDSGSDWANYSFDVRYEGTYRILAEPLLEVSDGAGSMPFDDLNDLLKAEVRDAGQAPVSPWGSVFPSFPYTDLSTNVNGMNQVGGFYDGRFNLTVGSYSVLISIDATKAGSLAGKGRSFRIELDSFRVEKFRLNATDWDVDRDKVPDGVEVNRSMMPLRADSDYDTLDDFEEINPGLDGYITSPILNDTDADGVLDAVEVGGTGDADGSTKTDPTSPDSDGDGLPDGWIDGWTWLANVSRYGPSNWWWWTNDGLRQPWEGEDLNGEGAVDTSDFALDGQSAESLGG